MKSLFLISTVLLVLHEVGGFKPFEIPEQGRTVPAWTEYLYFENVGTNTVRREYVLQESDQRTYLLCPKGYFIGELSSSLLLSREQIESNPDLKHKQAVFHHTAVSGLQGGVKEMENELEPEEHCPPLSRCLVYQACVFNFGNEFCQKDPNPGSRKNINLNITCVRDEFKTRIENVSPDQVEERINSVLNIVFQSKLDFGIEDFENTVLTDRAVPEKFVFDSGCPIEPYSAGYRGTCTPVEQLENSTVAENTWHLTSRIRSEKCKSRVLMVYCGFQFDRMGKCVPPFLVKPGNVPWNGTDVWSGSAYPEPGSRPSTQVLQRFKLLDKYKHKNLVPVRIGFALLVHKDVPAILQLLRVIYRPYNFYVLHVDYRKDDIREELVRELSLSLPARNIRVLPKHRSWTTSWGSFHIVRAHLEQFEELLRMGVWDFMINMSGSDLSIRSVDDLGFALAPYRGQNFFAFHGNIRNSDLNKDQGLCKEAWFACDGFTYNVTRSAGQPNNQQLEIKTASQWATLSYEFIQYILNTTSHHPTWRTYDFHMQTSVIPDESYFSTLSLNGPFRDKTHHVGLYWFKRFEGKDKYNLCKHLGDADFCGQGPSDIDESDLGELAEMTHRYFFARKFPTSNPHKLKTRETLIKYSTDEYYKVLRRYLSPQVLYQLMENAFKYLSLRGDIKSKENRGLKLSSVHVFPKLHPAQPCCSLPFHRHYKSVQEYAYVLDFQVHATPQPYAVRTKYNVIPQAICFPKGDLRVIRATGWSEEGSDTKKPVSVNTPFPFHPAGATAVFTELWFHASPESISGECKKSSNEMKGDLAIIQNIRKNEKNEVVGDTLYMVGTLTDPQGEVRCRREFDVVWSREHLHTDGEGNRVERAVMVTMDCGTMEAGQWKLSFVKNGSLTPYVYEISLLFLPPVGELSNLGAEPSRDMVDLLYSMWSLEDISLLPLENFYTGSQQSHSSSHLLPTLSRQSQPHPNHPHLSLPHKDSLGSGLVSMLLCQGGLLTLCICGLISYNLMNRSRYNRTMYNILTVLLFSSLVQIILCSIFCWD